MSDGSYTLFNAPSAYLGNTFASGINNSGQVAGSYWNPDTEMRGFVRSSDGNTYTTFDVPSSAPGNTYAIGINDSGQIVGYYADLIGIYHGFLRSSDGNTYTTLEDPLSPNWTLPTGINNSGQIVGYYNDGLRNHGFVRDTDGTYSTLDDPAAFYHNSIGFTMPMGINDLGQVTGYYMGMYDGFWANHGFVATPVPAAVPEPAGILLLGTVMIWLPLRLRRRGFGKSR